MADERIAKLRKDNVLAQRLRCSNCTRNIAQVGSISDDNMVYVEGKKVANTDVQAKGFQCDDCKRHPIYSKEGPREAMYIDNLGDIQVVYYDTLVDFKEPTTETVFIAADKEATRSTTTGKITKREK